jgi:Protein of unknown function (DUF2786)
MDTATRDRLINLLARTTSEHDGEALAAARKANQLLVRHGLTWADVISTRTPNPSAWRTAGGSPKASHSTVHGDTGVGMGAHHRPPPYSPAHPSRASPQRIARVCLGYGLGIGILLGAVVALLIAVGGDGSDPSGYELAGFVFALPALVGFVLWLMLGGWLPSRRTMARGRRFGSGGAD